MWGKTYIFAEENHEYPTMKSMIALAAVACTLGASAQTFTCIKTTETEAWKPAGKVKLASRPAGIIVESLPDSMVFGRWGTCFNERGYDTRNILPESDRADIMARVFAPDGELRFNMGRIPMNANDYARDWYSCDEVAGDFDLRYFNIDRDRTTLIPFIHQAQALCPDMTFWASPWSPPSWMKINADYPVRSDRTNTMDPRKDALLFAGQPDLNRDDYKAPKGIFPPKLSENNYFIMEPRYLQAYADYFGKFIDEYAGENIPIDMVMFQNESWSYTPYPGCAWTPEGIALFNTRYLAPTLARTHPDVDIYFGTINTNRYDVSDKVLSDSLMPASIKGVGFQWEGGQILPAIRKKYPDYRYVQTEGECGWGSFDWGAAEHTFERINHYLGNGAEDYTFWNFILPDDGCSGWGWKQNALIRVDSATGTYTLTPEYYAVRHYTNHIPTGSTITAWRGGNTPVLVASTPDGKTVVTAANLTDTKTRLAVPVGNKYLNITLAPHTLATYTD